MLAVILTDNYSDSGDAVLCYIITSDKGNVLLMFVCLSVCLSVCLFTVSKITKNVCMDLDEMLPVDIIGTYGRTD